MCNTNYHISMIKQKLIIFLFCLFINWTPESEAVFFNREFVIEMHDFSEINTSDFIQSEEIILPKCNKTTNLKPKKEPEKDNLPVKRQKIKYKRIMLDDFSAVEEGIPSDVLAVQDTVEWNYPKAPYHGNRISYIESAEDVTWKKNFSTPVDLSSHHFSFGYSIFDVNEFKVGKTDIYTGLFYTSSYISFEDIKGNYVRYPLSLISAYGSWEILSISRACPYRVESANKIDWSNITKIVYFFEPAEGKTLRIFLSHLEAIETISHCYLILRFDDALANVFTRGRPLMEQYGFKGVLGINASMFYDTDIYTQVEAESISHPLYRHLSIADFCTIEMLETFDKLGWDIVSHSADHYLVGSKNHTTETLIANLVSGRQLFERLGITRGKEYFIFPYTGVGPIRESVWRVFKNMYSIGLSGQPTGPLPLPVFDDGWRMGRLEIANTSWSPYNDYMGIGETMSEFPEYGGVGQIMWHGVSESDVSENGNFINLLKFLDANRDHITVVTLSELEVLFPEVFKKPNTSSLPEMIRTVDSSVYDTTAAKRYIIKPHDWGTHRFTNGGNRSMHLRLPPAEVCSGKRFSFLCVPELTGDDSFTIVTREGDTFTGGTTEKTFVFNKNNTAGGNIRRTFMASGSNWELQ